MTIETKLECLKLAIEINSWIPGRQASDVVKDANLLLEHLLANNQKPPCDTENKA
jgi:hypothetical protein